MAKDEWVMTKNEKLSVITLQVYSFNSFSFSYFYFFLSQHFTVSSVSQISIKWKLIQLPAATQKITNKGKVMTNITDNQNEQELKNLMSLNCWSAGTKVNGVADLQICKQHLLSLEILTQSCQNKSEDWNSGTRGQHWCHLGAEALTSRENMAPDPEMPRRIGHFNLLLSYRTEHILVRIVTSIVLYCIVT